MVTKMKISQAEVLLGLSKIAQLSFHNRRAVEWKVNFGVWTLLAAAIAMVVSNKIDICWCIAVIPASLMVIVHGIWLLGMHSRNKMDKSVLHFYQSEINKLLDVHERFEDRNQDHSPRLAIDLEKAKQSEYWSIRPSVCVSAILASVLTFLAST